MICLRSQTIKDFRLIIVDSSSSNETEEYIKSEFEDWVDYVKVNTDLFWTGAINAGIKYVQNNYFETEGLILLNDDTEVNVDFFEQLINLYNKENKALIGCVNLSAEDKSTVLWAGSKTNSWLAFTNYYFKGQNISNIKSNKITESFTLIGRGLFIPMVVFSDIGLFDEEHFKHRGDTEFPLRAKKEGYKLLVSLKSKVYSFPDQTYSMDIGKLRIRDFKKVFFDFRSSSYIKTRFYYAKSATTNSLQFLSFFIIEMSLHFRRYILRLFF
jgi:GT2 family glycosyltransferase